MDPECTFRSNQNKDYQETHGRYTKENSGGGNTLEMSRDESRSSIVSNRLLGKSKNIENNSSH